MLIAYTIVERGPSDFLPERYRVDLSTLDDVLCDGCKVQEDPFWGHYVSHDHGEAPVIFFDINKKNAILLLTSEMEATRNLAAEWILKQKALDESIMS